MKRFLAYIKGSVDELKKVAWPTKKQTIRLTALVIGVSVGVGLYVSGVDYLFTKAVSILLNGK